MTGTDILITAIEGGINYWAEVTDYSPDGDRPFAVIREIEGRDEYRLTPTAMTAAANKVVTLYPNTRAAGYIRTDNIDAEAADMIAQVACFGELVYG